MKHNVGHFLRSFTATFYRYCCAFTFFGYILPRAICPKNTIVFFISCLSQPQVPASKRSKLHPGMSGTVFFIYNHPPELQNIHERLQMYHPDFQRLTSLIGNGPDVFRRSAEMIDSYKNSQPQQVSYNQYNTMQPEYHQASPVVTQGCQSNRSPNQTIQQIPHGTPPGVGRGVLSNTEVSPDSCFSRVTSNSPKTNFQDNIEFLNPEKYENSDSGHQNVALAVVQSTSPSLKNKNINSSPKNYQ